MDWKRAAEWQNIWDTTRVKTPEWEIRSVGSWVPGAVNTLKKVDNSIDVNEPVK